MSTNNIGISSSGSHLYSAIKYKWSEEDKMMVPYFEKPVDRYKMIQASKNSTDIAAIVKRAAAGDVSVLNVKNGFYGDVSEVPDNMNDIHELDVEAINSFAKLDPKVQALFDNDYSKFADAVSDGSYVNIINNAILSNKEDSKEREENK